MISRGRRLVLSVIVAAATSAPVADAVAFVWPNVPDRVARALSSDDVTERRRAAEQLIDLPPAIAAPLTRNALGDPDVEVRLRAARAAIEISLPKAGDLVVSWLADADSRLRVAAADVVHASPTPDSVAALGRVLSDPSDAVRLSAAAAMGASSLDAAVSPLLGHLDDAAPEVRVEVARALGRLGDTRAVVPLIGKIQDAVPDVRRTVARSLGELGDDRATSALMLLLQDTQPRVQVAAIAALGQLQSTDATLAVAQVARGGDASEDGQASPEVRRAALRALGRIGSDEAIAVLIQVLEDESSVIGRSPARDALVAAGDKAVPALLSAVERSPNANVAAGAAVALGRIRASSRLGNNASAEEQARVARPVVLAMQRGAIPLRAGLRALASIGSSESLPAVLELIADPDPLVRREAIVATRQLLDPKVPDGRAVEPLTTALADVTTPRSERVLLVEVLGRTGAPRAQSALLDLLGTEDTALKRAAVRALGSLSGGSAEVDEALLTVLDDEHADLRLEAAMALSKVATPNAAKALVERLAISAEQDRGALGLALSGALSRVKSDAVADRVAALLERAPLSARDALLEGLGRMPTARADRWLAQLAKAPAIDDRRKVAEALSQRSGSVATLRQLAVDADSGVRANATWALGSVGGADEVKLLTTMTKDPDVAVAGNAAGALGRAVARTPELASAANQALCATLDDARPYVRANGIAALALAKLSCEGRPFDKPLRTDPSPSVRLAAARALWVNPTEAGNRALRQCAAEDRNAEVGAICDEPPRAAVAGPTDDVIVYVVPDGLSTPAPRAPFALVLPDGLMRLGIADRRGALLERGAPRGTIRLAVPAALAR